ncbi:ubiquitin carboxyl-terminal hydrolase MINDY-1-like [Selaginella moellendorffii]|uniref:ubiquitin carboxyl-terminal hydrolase MINDY-1-like n=1 Tax=Selaginella moellendorffii TaxID=88036 RepID=UPI000D1CDB24|nr:ubiquitin carboxyl-terminal hydrolase MINDY-1-like [Selaginella moellendorffii]|eukprot:XP_024543986.1 ubiquitin carboxyl-terminal hydrolase MINDY-1-like [Selaginella moellendorffii]
MGGNEQDRTDAVYKTKIVNFLGRPVPIILQNDNGPCPLIAICNVLLLRNNVTLHKDSPDISLQSLLILVAERLLDSNSNNQDKDENYIQNQQQNISDAISLLPRLATGIDVNVRFRNIHDFEFTPECAIFDLLDIGLVHGWLCDPQDETTSRAVGSNSYNVLVEKLVALHAGKPAVEEEPTVDFAAATTASLGVPSPGLCSRTSFEGLQFLDFTDQKQEAPETLDTSLETETEGSNEAEETRKRKGDEEEAAQLLDALNLSRVDVPSTQLVDTENGASSPKKNPVETEAGLKEWPSMTVWVPEKDGGSGTESLVTVAEDSEWQTKIDRDTTESSQLSSSSDFECVEVDDCRTADSSNLSGEAEKMESATADSIAEDAGRENEGRIGIDEPLYEGETTYQSFEGDFENRELLYEGEAVIADSEPGSSGSDLRTSEALAIENFLSSHASQLTYYGLFSLQEGLKERELCVFFRNNHFSAMFKYEGDLFLLVTDQGYLNEPDVVWEKLTEVDGDSVFFTGNFTLFKADDRNTSSWNERDAVAATADYISQMGKPVPAPQTSIDPSYNSDLELAMALQQQEFDQQQNQQNQQPQQQQQQQQQQSPRKPSNSPRKGHRQSSGITPGRLVTGPSSASPPPKSSDSKPKDKCKLM